MLSFEELRSLWEPYDLPFPEELTPLGKGHMCQSYRVWSGGNEYVLRVRPQAFGPRELGADHAFLAFLSHWNLAVPRVIQRGDGKSYGLATWGQYYELHSYIPHDDVVGDGQFRRFTPLLAAFLGRFHEASRSYSGSLDKPVYAGNIPIGFFAKYFDGPLRWGVRRYLKCAQGREGREGEELFWRTRELAFTLVELREQMCQFYSTMERLVNHNDFCGQNLLRRGEDIVGLVDFDLASTGPCCVDLVELLHGSLVWDENHWDYWGLHPEGRVRVSQGVRDHILYKEAGGLGSVNWPMIKIMLKAKLISLVFYPAYDVAASLEDRLEITYRLRRTLEEIDRLL